MKLTKSLYLLGFLLPLSIYAQIPSNEPIELAKSIKTDTFFKHLGILASDSFEGRGTGTIGYNRATDYVVSEIQKLGLQPGGIDGSYFQPIAFESRKIEKSSVAFNLRMGDKLLTGEFGSDISILPNIKSSSVHLEETIVFLGYGLEIPELGINDFKGIDVKGKTVIIAVGLPDSLDKKIYGKYINPFEKIKILEKKGVTGLIFYTNIGIFQNLIFKQINNFFQEPWFDYKDPNLYNPMLNFSSNLLVYSKKDFIKMIFDFNGISFKETTKAMDKGEFMPFTFKSGLEVNYTANTKSVPCKNIVAIVPGTDPELKSEYVVLSAHLDHLGIGKAIKKDSIYNGAWDNASGSSTLLSVAETYKQMTDAPKRSIIFLWVTAEEKGLLGSHYFAQQPTVPSKKIVADLSLDMAGGIFEATDIIPMGYKMSNLSQAVDFAAAALHLKVDTTSSMEKEYFERSDHFSFVSAGVPSLLLFGGLNAVDPKIAGEKTYKKWEKKIYHSPSDDMKQDFSKEAFLQGIQVHFLVSWYIANEIDEIKWNKESALYKKYIGK